MTANYNVLRYSSSDKMSELVCDKYHMLLVLNRFGIDMGFKDASIEQVCNNSGIDVNTFLAVVNLLIASDKGNFNIENIYLPTLLIYLKNSHDYFGEYKLPEIREKLIGALAQNNAVSLAVINYYDEYIADVRSHMQYEEEVVFTHAEKLISGADDDFDVIDFSKHHHSVDDKLAELKNIIVKYYTTKSTNELSSVLFDIFTCEKDLASHCDIEDYLLIPAIKKLENK